MTTIFRPFDQRPNVMVIWLTFFDHGQNFKITEMKWLKF